MAKPIYRIVANKPEYQRYGQYVSSDISLEDLWDKTGLSSPFTDDDLYTTIDGDESYNFNSWTGNMPANVMDWGSLSGAVTNGDSIIYKGWRPVSNIFVGNKLNLDMGTYLQQYYKFDDMDYFRTSAPNIAHLYFDFYHDDSTFDLYGNGKWFDILETHYRTVGEGSVTADTIMASDEFVRQRPRLKVINWDWKEGDIETLDPKSYTSPADGGFLVEENGTPIIYSHQYNEPGIKIIKALVYINLNHNEFDQQSNYYYYKNLTITLNVGLDGIYIEDFSLLGGPDFTFLPWPETSFIIGGISKESDYYSSVRKIIKKNPFSKEEAFDKFFAQKAFLNDETGKSLPDMDLQQIRVFEGGAFDMNYILGINTQVAPDAFTFNHFSEEDYWTGEDGYIFNRNSPLEIFIDDVEDSALRYNCIMEFSGVGVPNNYLIDTSSNGIKGILVGDYKVKKDMRDVPAMRDSVMNTLEIEEDENGAV